MLYALIAATHRTGPRVPLPRARALAGICLTGDAIGRRTGARGVDGPGAVGLTGRSTVGATGIAWRRSIGWSRGAGEPYCACAAFTPTAAATSPTPATPI